jgi:DNA-directed RNA polymerase subunit beta
LPEEDVTHLEKIARKNYSKIPALVDIPNLLDVQLESYKNFILSNGKDKPGESLQSVFETIFPIVSARENFVLEFISYNIGEPKYSVDECQERDLTFSAPLKAKLRLIIKVDEEGERKVKDVMEAEVFLGELPLITDKGTFIINGAERVIVSQLHRSPGVFFSDAQHPNGKRLFSARIIPYRGSWVEFTTDINDVMYVHIDRKRKQPATILLRAVGFDTDAKILQLFFKTEPLPVTKRASKTDQTLIGRYVAEDVVSPETGEVLMEAGHEITEELLIRMRTAGVEQVLAMAEGEYAENDIVRNTLRRDSTKNEEEALKKIYNLLRPGDPPSVETARQLLDRLFFNPRRYNLSSVGRYKMNQRLHLDIPLENATLTPTDFIAVTAALLDLANQDGEVDDIDHLGNRRIRSVGELLANQFSLGLSRMARIIRERMSLQDAESITPYDLVNARTISAVIQSFFGSSQLSQFMDQTNPLAELTHKRRLSALGPGGLTRERAGFEVRDVHHTHYGRMCPIETPEGPNIGLITSLSTFARVNRFGFLETPYRKVDGGKASTDVVFLSADEEDENLIAQASEPLRSDGAFVREAVPVRYRDDFPQVQAEQIRYMDVSPMQPVSAAAALIPFLEHDDANRALMGCNMQRQAVPLLRTEPPLVGTGMEEKIARDSGAITLAKRGGVIKSVSADAVLVQYKGRRDEVIEDFSGLGGLDEYKLQKYRRSNQDTCINQRPVVRVGQKVEKGDIIADGPATHDGELALGHNVLVAFMPWCGYNFEDAIILSESLVKDDKFTSIHIEEFECQVRDTKAGMEEITREIPNVGEEALRKLDDDGIVMVGARVKSGDILVGKVTPKGETDLSPEERLLRAIFGEKAGDVRDASLKAPPGMEGLVVDIKVFSRRERDERSKAEEKKKLERLRRALKKEETRIKQMRDEKLHELMEDQTSERLVHAETGEIILRANTKLAKDKLVAIDFDHVQWGMPIVQDQAVDKKVKRVLEAAGRAVEKATRQHDKEVERVQRGDELPPGVVKLVKVYIARKRKISVGDKMAGRHGNKGVVAKIVPVEDMPYLPDGSPVEIILNPLGVPSRMNLGQILETHLGWAASKLGFYCASPVFDGATIDEIKAELRAAGLPESGKSVLFDGRSGEAFDEEVTVGMIYMMKLSHLVDDKIHARSIGPYSLVTQQPLGGKAQFGGQRFGEMEVWALEAYGAAYCLQELLTVKSDDVLGRSKIYEAIVKGENPPEPGIPESFNVLVKELQSLCLDVQLEMS